MALLRWEQVGAQVLVEVRAVGRQLLQQKRGRDGAVWKQPNLPEGSRQLLSPGNCYPREGGAVAIRGECEAAWGRGWGVLGGLKRTQRT